MLPLQSMFILYLTLTTSVIFFSVCTVPSLQSYDKGCSQRACFKCCTDENCEGHRDQREMAKNKDSIMEGTNWINKLAAQKRALAVVPGAFREPAFHYLGETVLIWSLKDFMSNPKWRDDSIRRSRKNRECRDLKGCLGSTTRGKSCKGMNDEDERLDKKQVNPKPNELCGVKEIRSRRFKRVINDLYRDSLWER